MTRPKPERSEIQFDVDETLVKDEPSDWQIRDKSKHVEHYDLSKDGKLPIMFDYYGIPRVRWVHKRHRDLVLSHYKRGCDILVQSANGKPWADEVVDKLCLDKYVHETKKKPHVMFDDKAPSEWCSIVWVEDK